MTANKSYTEELDFQAQRDDPLLNCLIFMAKYFAKPFSAHALTSGLPLDHGRLTAKLVPRAAARAGMDAHLSKKSLSGISELLLPCVLMLKDGRACVLLECEAEKYAEELKLKNEQENPEPDSNDLAMAKIVWPETSGGEDEISLQELDELYVGFCFFIRKKHRFDQRSEQTLTNAEGHWFWSVMKKSFPIYRDVLIASLFINLFAIASPLFVMNVYDRVVPNLAFDTLWVLAVGMLLVLILDFALKETRSYLLELAAKKADILLSSEVFSKVINLELSSRPQSVGAFARNVQEFDSIREFITSATVAAFVDVPFAALIITIIFIVTGPMALIPVAVIILMVAYSLYMKHKIRIEVEKGARFSMQKNAHLIETLVGSESIKINSAESQFQGKWEELVGHISDWNLGIKRYSSRVSSMTAFYTQLTSVIIIVVGVYQIMEGNISMGALIACVMLTSRALGPFSSIALLATRYNQAESAFKTLDELMNLPSERYDKFLHRPFIDGSVKFKNVDFTYPGSETTVLNNVNFSVKPQEKVAIIGRIGAGKSSIEKLLLGLYQPTGGSIYLDEIDIKQINPADLRQKIGCLPQDINLFYGSIRDNITLGVPHVDDDLVLRAARNAGVTSFSDTHPEGLDRQVGERGAYLSGGQRQSVALARALLFNPPILVLDEPSSNMDSYSEQNLKQNLNKLVKDKTFVLITHKFSMLDLVDRIIVIEQGQVVADGPKQQVLQQLQSKGQGKSK